MRTPAVPRDSVGHARRRLRAALAGVGHTFPHGAWAWIALVVVLCISYTLLGEELLFRTHERR